MWFLPDDLRITPSSRSICLHTCGAYNVRRAMRNMQRKHATHQCATFTVQHQHVTGDTQRATWLYTVHMQHATCAYSEQRVIVLLQRLRRVAEDQEADRIEAQERHFFDLEPQPSPGADVAQA
jgi:3-methyladenine DNA glycosylase/8-oxoguanine DNA glycosylase